MDKNDEELAWLAGIGLAFGIPAIGIPALALGAFAKWGAKPTGTAIAATAKGSWWLTKKVIEKSKKAVPAPKPPAPLTKAQLVEAERMNLEEKIALLDAVELSPDEREFVIDGFRDEFTRKIAEILK